MGFVYGHDHTYMADQLDTTAPALTNGASTSIAAQRAATLAAMEAGEHLEKPAEKSAPVEKVEPEAADVGDPVETDAEETADVEAEDDEAEKPADKADDKTDPDITKRLAQVQKAERRVREAMARERAEAKAEMDARVAHIQKEWGPRVEKAEAFEKLAARAKHDPVGALMALGLTATDLGPAGRAAFAASDDPAATANPAAREHAMRMLREREQSDKATATEKRLAELEQKIASEREAAAFEQQKSQYLGDAVKSAGDDAPLLKSAVAKNPAKAHKALWSLAEQHFDEHGEMPTNAEVVTAYEKARRAELEELGIDVATVVKAAPKKAVDEKKVAAKPAPKKADGEPKSIKEQREETRRLLEAGKLD